MRCSTCTPTIPTRQRKMSSVCVFAYVALCLCFRVCMFVCLSVFFCGFVFVFLSVCVLRFCVSYSFRRFRTCFRPLWTGHSFPYKCRILRYSCFPTGSDGFRLVSDFFELATNFSISVGPADIAAAFLYSFRRFQTCFKPLWTAH